MQIQPEASPGSGVPRVFGPSAGQPAAHLSGGRGSPPDTEGTETPLPPRLLPARGADPHAASSFLDVRGFLPSGAMLAPKCLQGLFGGGDLPTVGHCSAGAAPLLRQPMVPRPPGGRDGQTTWTPRALVAFTGHSSLFSVHSQCGRISSSFRPRP